MQQTRQLPKLYTRASFVPASFNEQDRTVELTWSTGAQVRRIDMWTDKEWIEELSMDRSHVNLERLNAGAPLLANHDKGSLSDVLGVVERAWIDGGQGRGLVRFSAREDVTPYMNDVKTGILRSVSVGYQVNKFEKLEQKQNDLTVYRAIDWTPMEISIVPIPADHGAQIRASETFNTVTIISKEDNTMTEKVENTQTEQTRAAIAVPTDPVRVEKTIDETAIRSEAARHERARVSEIRKFGKLSQSDDAVINDMIERGIALEEAKNIMLQKWSAKVDAECIRGDASVTVDARDKFIEAGVNAIRGRAGVDKMDAGNEFRGMRLTEIAKLCLQRAGFSASGMDEREMVKRAFTQTTSDFPVLLENAMHKTLQQAYATAPDTWSRFCSTGSLSDFRAHNRYRQGSFGNLDLLNEASEYKNKSIPDGEKATITATTKGNIINISRQTIINDDLGAFVGLSQMLGRAARRTIEADVYALLASNPVMIDGLALFHASHGNLAAAGAAVSVATIEAGRVAIAKQLDVSGNDYLDLRPKIWLGGVQNGGEARVTNDSQYDNDGTKLQKPNKVRGLFADVVDSPRITGTEWYMFADAMDAPVIEVGFLNGEQAPFLDSMEGFNVDGMQWKVRLDYGVAAIDYRGAYKNPGA